MAKLISALKKMMMKFAFPASAREVGPSEHAAGTDPGSEPEN
jgi:hypothetical protein